MLGSARLSAVRTRVRQLPWAEVCVAASLVAGWMLVTWAIASFSRTWQVWPLSAGLFLLSLFGWRYLWVMSRDGLYTLTREPKR